MLFAAAQGCPSSRSYLTSKIRALDFIVSRIALKFASIVESTSVMRDLHYWLLAKIDSGRVLPYWVRLARRSATRLKPMGMSWCIPGVYGGSVRLLIHTTSRERTSGWTIVVGELVFFGSASGGSTADFSMYSWCLSSSTPSLRRFGLTWTTVCRLTMPWGVERYEFVATGCLQWLRTIRLSRSRWIIVMPEKICSIVDNNANSSSGLRRREARSLLWTPRPERNTSHFLDVWSIANCCF